MGRKGIVFACKIGFLWDIADKFTDTDFVSAAMEDRFAGETQCASREEA